MIANDIVLSSLINLFALFGARKSLARAKSEEMLVSFLSRHFGVRDPRSYIELFNDLRDFYESFPDMDKDAIVEGICSKLQGQLQSDEQSLLLLRLMEFCSLDPESFNPNDEVFTKVATHFDIKEDLFAEFVNFVTCTEDAAVKVLDYAEGKLKTLFIKAFNKLVFSFTGEQTVYLNDIPVLPGVFQIWQQSGVMKSAKSAPLYFSSIMAVYGDVSKGEKTELCGRDVNFIFPNSKVNGMHNFSFSLNSGELVAIMGGSGVGKSTLLALLNGNLQPDSGAITVNGHSLNEPEAKALIGYVPQDDLLIEELTVYQNLWYTAKLCFAGLDDEHIDQKVISVLRDLGLEQAKDLKVGSALSKYISGGQRKRLNIALELIREPAVLFLDEPTSGLSSADTEMVVGLLKEQTYKGKLIVCNIHQPSSDVYKLFDRLWLLDKGGFPVFDGNPIDAITYFKTAAGYVDSQASTCPTCGNVNPEVVLNIIDEKSLDDTGQITDKRKTTPQEWHQMYLDKRPDMAAPVVSAIPPSEQKRPSFIKQMWIFLKRNITAKVTNLQYMLITLLEAPVLALICAFLTKYAPSEGYSVMDNKNMVSYFFMAVIVAVFIGMSGSAEEIFKDRALLKREKFLQLSYGSYIWSKIIYMAAVSLVQTLLFVLVGNAVMEIHDLFFVWWAVLFVSALLSNLIGLMLSQTLGSVVAIYITIPLLLIPQILLCGLVVDFDDLNPNSKTGNVPLIGEVIPSRWAFEALAVTSFTSNAYERNFYEQDRDKFTAQYYEHVFLYELESQLETHQWSIDNGETPDPQNMLVLKTELPRLVEECGLPEYEGDWSYKSLLHYLEKSKRTISKWGNVTTLEMDRKMTEYIKANGRGSLVETKTAHYNLQLENLVLNRGAEKTHKVVGGHILPKCGYVFLRPVTRNGRAPFYSGVKMLGYNEIPTLWFNIFVLLLMCIIIGTGLFFDFPGRFVRKDRNL